MDVTVTPSQLSGSICSIPSKSVAHRALICAMLSSNSEIAFQNIFYSKDIEATVGCIESLGGKYNQATSTLSVGTYKTGEYALCCFESGSTLRFMLPVALALGGKFAFQMEGRLPERPLSPLYEQLVSKGIRLSPKGENPFYAEGLLPPGSYKLPGNVSSQFISGLLLALPILHKNSTIEIVGRMESMPYLDITRAVQTAFGIETHFENNTFYIPGNQKYIAPSCYTIEGDWSNAAFWLCAEKIGKSCIAVSGLRSDSAQGDKVILDILKKLPCEIDATDIPDLIPAVCAVAAVTDGETTIRNAQRLIIKESNRLEAVCHTLSTLGASIQRTDDGLIVKGKAALDGGTVDSYNDHRIAMMAAIATVACKNEVTIKNAQAVTKSYPAFWDDFQTLGGKVRFHV